MQGSLGLRPRPQPTRSGRHLAEGPGGHLCIIVMIMQWVPAGSFERLSSVPVLWSAARDHARGKRRRPAVAAFNLDVDTHVFALHRALRGGRYRPGPHHQLVVHDPKTRLISTPSLRDRVLHQALVTEIGPHFNRSFIEHSFGCLSRRGPQRALLCYLRWTRHHRYRLSLDIRRYFPSIDHELLLGLLSRRVRDPRTRTLLTALVSAGGEVYRTPLAVQVLGLATDPVLPNTGIPIGSCLSQWSANVYLDGLDHFVKRTLRVPAYLRYMDDFTLFADHPAELLAARAAIEGWLAQHRRLALGRRRWHVHPTSEPSTFVGYRVTRGGVSMGETMLRRLRCKVRAAAHKGMSELARTLQSYQALSRFA